jgi:hypothetical protein
MTRKVLLLELNEINFEFVEGYAAQGALPALGELMRRHGVSRTVSERRYEELEPWIQWVTAHTGLTLSQHGVFRLGDIVDKDIPQIWEQLEAAGLRVGALSPMNAKHRLRAPAFFVPDPWTNTEITAPKSVVALYRAIAKAVNDNAQSKLSASSGLALLWGLLRYGSLRNAPLYSSLAARALTQPWTRAIFLDLLLADVFIQLVRTTQPDFATLFLNAGAHIQHHYMFCSPFYRGAHRNPEWYVPKKADPILEVFQAYDRIVGAVRARFPDARLVLATGLHQVPHQDATYYWRLRDHAAFLRRIGVEFARVEPRMSRDFLLVCDTPEGARAAERRLSAAKAADGLALFEVDNRGSDLFVMLTYAKDIGADFVFEIDGERYSGLKNDVAFVALKNGEHNGIGYFLDAGAPAVAGEQQFPLSEIPARIFAALGLNPAGMNPV